MNVIPAQFFPDMKIAILTLALLLCGCASKKSQPAKVFERPWIGGRFEAVRAPEATRTNGFGKHGLLLTRLYEETPLAHAGLKEGDLVLSVDGKNVRHVSDLRPGSAPMIFKIYREGEVAEKSVTPGTERYEKFRAIVIGVRLSTKCDVDIWPNPDFSLGAIGFEEKSEPLDLRDPKSKYLSRQKAKDPTWSGLASDDRWKIWLGPFEFAQTKLIVSQEAASK